MPMPVSSQAPYQPASEGRQAIMAQLAAISKVPLVTTSLPPKRASNERGHSGHHQHRKRQAEIDLRQGPSFVGGDSPGKGAGHIKRDPPVDELLTARGEGKASGNSVYFHGFSFR